MKILIINQYGNSATKTTSILPRVGDNDPAGNKSWLSKACDHRLLLDKDLDETPDNVIVNAINKIT